MLALLWAPTSWPESAGPALAPVPRLAPRLAHGSALVPPPRLAHGGRPLPPGLEVSYDQEMPYSTHANIDPIDPKAWDAVRKYTRGQDKEFEEERKKSGLLTGQPRWSGLHSLLTPPWIYVFLAFLYYLGNGGYSAE